MMRYMRPLLERGDIDPSFVIGHRVPLDRAPEIAPHPTRRFLFSTSVGKSSESPVPPMLVP